MKSPLCLFFRAERRRAIAPWHAPGVSCNFSGGYYYALIGLLAGAPKAALCCDAVALKVHRSGQLIWCADPDAWAAHKDDVTPFFRVW